MDRVFYLPFAQYVICRRYRGQPNTPLQTFARSTRFCLPQLINNLKPGTQPDRMKGALHTLGNKAISENFMPPSLSRRIDSLQSRIPSLASTITSGPRAV